MEQLDKIEKMVNYGFTLLFILIGILSIFFLSILAIHDNDTKIELKEIKTQIERIK